MIGVQSCKHFGCQRSHPTILGFGHPSGALEDGAREKFLVPGTILSCGALKQWKCTDYDPMWSLCILSRVKCKSFSLRAGQTNKLSNFVVRGEYCQVSKFFYGQPYMVSMYSRVNCESFSLLSGQTKKLSNIEVRDEFFQVGKFFLLSTLNE